MNTMANVPVSNFLHGTTVGRGGLHKWEKEHGIGEFNVAMAHPIFVEEYIFFSSDTPHGVKKWRSALFASGSSLAALASENKSRAMEWNGYHLYHGQLLRLYHLDKQLLSGLSSSKVRSLTFSSLVSRLFCLSSHTNILFPLCTGRAGRPGDGQLGEDEREESTPYNEQALCRHAP